ncbi:pentatricopeptide repeat-containing protein At2g36980, mitochondrial [Impatiens glandulifera]|uniref:pentatricopeptide repeat-containing protein At2g36980, mitochondrial n=1 Tax=Impatiens glandulifera TaxID=253017 RepID=UPI001FB088CF|nr:pentatricopeptide repeat-containing protein At2g36980, mitochondrial [Impatiens glandulifera]
MHSNLVRSTSTIKALARSGRIECARKLFDGMPSRDTIAWNAMLGAYSQLGLCQESLCFLRHMRISNHKPDHFSFSSAISACAGSCELIHGQRLHALVIITGCNSSLPVNNSLIDMYGKCRIPSNASKVFSQMTHQNEVSWCSLLFAFTNVGRLGIAREIFHTMPSKVNIAWNTMISSHARIGDVEFCIDLFRRMLLKCSCGVDHWTLSALMNACTESDEEASYGLMVHAFILKTGWSTALEANNSVLSFYAKISSHDDVIKVYESTQTLSQVSWNAIIDAHMKVGEVEKAFLAFQQAPEKNIVSWTSMISGFARNGHDEKSFSFFVEMMSSRETKTGSTTRPDGFTLGATLHACSNLASLERGRMVHGCVIRYGLFSSTYVGNGLVNMYAKCGEIDDSNGAFSEIVEKDIVSWNTMLFGYGLHGRGKQALSIFNEMMEFGMKPDKVTFIVLLMGCSYSGLIEEGRDIFCSIGVNTERDHVACMVDLLGRGGYSEEAKELAKEAGLSLEMENEEMSYVMLSNLYCASGMWREAEITRKIMADRGLRKTPGCSWIEIKEVT